MSPSSNNINIEKKGSGNFCEYVVRPYNLKRPAGYAHVEYEPFEDYDSTIKKSLSNLFNEDDVLANIVRFYPNGELRMAEGKLDLTQIEPYSRQGVGSKVLKMIVDDSQSYGAQGLVAFTKEIWMASFLGKYNFIPCNGSHYDFYRLL